MVTSRKIDKIVEARASIIVLASPKHDVISPVRREPKKLMGKERNMLDIRKDNRNGQVITQSM